VLCVAREIQRKANVGVELHGCSLLLCVQYSIKKRSVDPCYICLQGQNAVDNVSRFVVEFQQGSIAQLGQVALVVLGVLEEVFGDELAHDLRFGEDLFECVLRELPVLLGKRGVRAGVLHCEGHRSGFHVRCPARLALGNDFVESGFVHDVAPVTMLL